ncbi:hypothetical protein B0H10DRAFT_1963534 [Mycena sp. CBHHK59/15]|nr:hypothetical protein B0H10DRAFT_1963534 [Mycena sp. CBHHK59/15]
MPCLRKTGAHAQFPPGDEPDRIFLGLDQTLFLRAVEWSTAHSILRMCRPSVALPLGPTRHASAIFSSLFLFPPPPPTCAQRRITMAPSKHTPAEQELLEGLTGRQVKEFRNFMYTGEFIALNAARFLDHEWIDIPTSVRP